MPLFRMLGGTSSSSSNNNNATSRSSNFMGMGGNNNSNNTAQQQQRSRGISSGSSSNSSTYPGLRIQHPTTTQTTQRNSNSNNNRNSNYCTYTRSSTRGGSTSIGGGLFSSIRNSTLSSSNSTPYVSNNTASSSSSSFPSGVIRAPSRASHQTSSSSSSTMLPPGVRPYVNTTTNNNNNRNSGNTTNRSSANNNNIASRTRSASNAAAGAEGAGAAAGAANSTITSTTTRPGAYAVTRSTDGMQSQVYRVTVPPGVTPGNEFTVHAGTRRVRVRCPMSSRPGHSLQITLPPEPITNSKHLHAAPLTRACSIVSETLNNTVNGSNNKTNNDDAEEAAMYAFPGRSDVAAFGGGGGAVPMTPEVRDVNRKATTSGGTAQTFLVTIPPNVYPGMQFTVNANGQRFMVTCPKDAGPNRKVRIVPPPTTNTNNTQQQSSASGETPGQEPLAAPKTQVFEVVVPPGVRPNQPFTLMANGQRVLVTCPPNVAPGQKIRFQLPVHENAPQQTQTPNIQLSYKDEAGSSGWCRTIRVTDMKFQWVRVDNKTTKDGNSKSSTEAEYDAENKKKKANDIFNLFGGGSSSNNQEEEVNPAREQQQQQGQEGDSSSMGAKAVDTMEAFDFGKAAYVRKIQYLEGNDARMRTGSVTLVPAQEAVVDSKLVDHNYHGTEQTKTLISYTDIATVQSKTLDAKIDWFRTSICEELYTPWEQGHVKIIVRRHSLLLDSVEAVMALSREDMRKRWRFEFVGEPGIEAGGLTREWFQLVTEQIFDPDFGLWLSSNNNQMSMQINAASHISCPDDHLIYFRFLGRVMGRALFDQQLIKGHMVRHLYKHILGWPITFDDLEAQDEEYYNSLKKFTTMEDLTVMCLDFTITEETLGVRNDIELIPGGNMKEVTSENLSQYLEANLKYRMLNRCKPQITELMLGFFDIIPESALTVFDPNELELILCGLPTIDMEDWMDNTKYSGYYESKGRRDQVVQWFWDVIQNDFDQEMQARLLQFVTGTSGVPPRGFSVLQGNDGNIKKFCIHGVSRDQYVYPRAHTCFNRIDLPNYSSKKELREKLGQAVSMTYVGFDIE